jgi:hypothetical protein
MPRITIIRLAILSFFAFAIVACSDPNTQSGFNPETGKHLANWAGTHWSAFLPSMAQCAECHGADYNGGISNVSCNSPGLNGMTCHGGAGWQHLTGWSNPDLHGPFAKGAPSGFSGFSYCKNCHGSDFTGGTSGTPCLNSSCHGAARPHPAGGWSSPRSHTTTNQGNASVCYDCHSGQPGVPGCFNNTLCHGPKD